MKPKILKLSTVVFLLLFIGASCQKDEIEYADDNIEILADPGISIYKTASNYEAYLPVCIDTIGNITCTPLFGDDSLIVKKDKTQNYLLKNRYFLKSGYILEDINFNSAFTDISIDEMIDKYMEFGPQYWTLDKYYERIIDDDPFIEFYYLSDIEKRNIVLTIGEINDMIQNETLETVFKRLK